MHVRLGGSAKSKLASTVGSTPEVDRNRAIQIARKTAADRGYPWIEPTNVSERNDEFHVSSNAQELGGNVLVVISRTTGEVREVHYYDR